MRRTSRYPMARSGYSRLWGYLPRGAIFRPRCDVVWRRAGCREGRCSRRHYAFLCRGPCTMAAFRRTPASWVRCGMPPYTRAPPGCAREGGESVPAQVLHRICAYWGLVLLLAAQAPFGAGSEAPMVYTPWEPFLFSPIPQPSSGLSFLLTVASRLDPRGRGQGGSKGDGPQWPNLAPTKMVG